MSNKPNFKGSERNEARRAVKLYNKRMKAELRRQDAIELAKQQHVAAVNMPTQISANES